jgi:hypothetical protein
MMDSVPDMLDLRKSCISSVTHIGHIRDRKRIARAGPLVPGRVRGKHAAYLPQHGLFHKSFNCSWI